MATSEPQPVGIDVQGRQVGCQNRWTELQMAKLVELRNYHFQMSGYLNSIIEKGPDSIYDFSKPNQPKHSLNKIFESTKQKQKAPLAILQKDLEDHLLPETELTNSFVGPINWATFEGKNFDHPRLKEELAPIVLAFKNRKILGDYLSFGQHLERWCVTFQHNKIMGDVSGTWEQWLADKDIKLQDSKKYRQMYKLLKNHVKFWWLRIAFDKIYQKRDQIELFLQSSEEFSAFWK